MDETRIYSVDSETFNELSHANDELIQYLQWLIERKDLEAINKLSPIVRRTTDLFLAILEGAFPEISHVIDAFNKLRDEITSGWLGPVRQRRLRSSLSRSMSSRATTRSA